MGSCVILQARFVRMIRVVARALLIFRLQLGKKRGLTSAEMSYKYETESSTTAYHSIYKLLYVSTAEGNV